ncbi:MAG: hypothetical protein KKB20_10495 [Proteobacteria bacterium]|nr:hypothetical protein [Pseudomonadota bacterium]
MPLIHVVPPDQAQGEIKEVYDAVKAVTGVLPRPLQMSSVSPELLKIQARILKYFVGNPNLGLPLAAHIRYLIASHNNYQFCTDFNASLLTMFGNLTEEDLDAVGKDVTAAKLDDKDRAMLEFVVKAIKDPSSTRAADTQRLRELGWTDQDIFDALYHGAGMVSAGIMFKALKMDED